MSIVHPGHSRLRSSRRKSRGRKTSQRGRPNCHHSWCKRTTWKPDVKRYKIVDGEGHDGHSSTKNSSTNKEDITVMSTIQTSSEVMFPRKPLQNDRRIQTNVKMYIDEVGTFIQLCGNIFSVSREKEDTTKLRTCSGHSDREWKHGLDNERKR